MIIVIVSYICKYFRLNKLTKHNERNQQRPSTRSPRALTWSDQNEIYMTGGLQNDVWSLNMMFHQNWLLMSGLIFTSPIILAYVTAYATV